MVKMYTPEYSDFLDKLCYDEANELYATGLSAVEAIRVEKRSAIEAVLVQQFLKYQERSMDPELAAKVFKTFDEVEMPMQVGLLLSQRMY